MTRRRRWMIVLGLALILALMPTGARVAASKDGAYEVWVIDQSDTTADGGGTLYIYRGEDVSGQDAGQAVPEAIDLGGAARDLCLATTGSAPRRPHMFMFNAANTHAAIAFVATGHVLFMSSHTREPVGCLDVGVQAHAVMISNDDTFALVANQNGKLLQRITTDYETDTFTIDNAATLNLATCTTPNGAACQDPVLRPDTAPICPALDSENRLAFITLRGGGLFVVDPHDTPMRLIAEYDKATVHPDGCGGIEANGKMYINSGGPLHGDLYAFDLVLFNDEGNPPNYPAPFVVFSQDDRKPDSHGVTRTKHSRYVWAGGRAANDITVVDAVTDSVVNQFTLVGTVSGDPAPDIMDISPSGNRVFVALRGAIPLTGGATATGSTPGVGVVRVEQGGRTGTLFTRIPITHAVGGVERADPHGLAVRRVP